MTTSTRPPPWRRTWGSPSSWAEMPPVPAVCSSASWTGREPPVRVPLRTLPSFGLALAVGADGDAAVAATLHGAADRPGASRLDRPTMSSNCDCAPVTVPGCSRSWGGRVRCRLPAWPFAQPSRGHSRGREPAQPDPEPEPASAEAVPAAPRGRRRRAARCRHGERQGGAARRRGEQRQDRADARHADTVRRTWTGSGTRPAPATAPN